MENTHLVKGLDFVLLHKKQREIADETKRERALSSEEAASVNLAGRQVVATVGGIQAVQTIAEFSSHLGRAIHRSVFSGQRATVSDHFLPVRLVGFISWFFSDSCPLLSSQGRTSFVYDLDPDMNLAIPTIVSRPKDEAPEERELIWCAIHSDLLSKVSSSFSRRLSMKPKRKVPTFQPPPAVSSVIPKISLFGDVDDDYSPFADGERDPSPPPSKRAKLD